MINKFLIAAVIVFAVVCIVNYTIPQLVIFPMIALFVCAIGAFATNKKSEITI